MCWEMLTASIDLGYSKTSFIILCMEIFILKNNLKIKTEHKIEV